MSQDARLTLRTPQDLIAMVPYLLEFQPQDSLVILCVDANRMVFNGARIDLDAPLDDMVAALQPVVTLRHVSAVHLIGYGPAGSVDTIKAAAVMIGASVPVHATMLVTGNTFFCLCEKPGCTATNGLVFDPRTTVAAADLTMHGYVALPSRDALLALVEPDPQAHDRIHAAINQLSPTRAVDRTVVTNLMRQAAQGVRLTDEQAADLAVRLCHPVALNTAWLATHAPNAMGNFCFEVTLGYRKRGSRGRVLGGL